VTKYSKSLQILALVKAGDRDMDISRVEKRLRDTQRSLLVSKIHVAKSIAFSYPRSIGKLLLGVDTSLEVSKNQLFHELLRVETFHRYKTSDWELISS
jgi:hypothetical protein